MANQPNMIVKGVAEWACVHSPNQLSNKYQIDICQLDKKDIKALEDSGVTVKNGSGDKAGKGSYVTAKTVRPPKIMDAAKKEWPNTIMIGNGSTVKCSVTPFEWVFQKKSGVSVSLNAVMVLDFKDAGMSSVDLEAEDGFVLDDLDINSTEEDL
jgi:hypothetical protein|tara:strand:- start:373 stop:834 length:462 start_codon:yes stop_codon:yes gene_type:complete